MLAEGTSQYYGTKKAYRKKVPVALRATKACSKYPSTTLYYKACREKAPEILRTAKLAQGAKGAKGAKGQPLLLHTTKLGHSISQYYFVVQSLREALPCTMSYCKSLQQVTQYYFVLQSLQKVRPSTTSYCKACTGGERGQEGNQYYLELQSLGLPNK